MRILGIDPGSRLTGYGCIDVVGNHLIHVTHGTLVLANTSGKATIPLEERLLSIHKGLSEIILEFKPQVLAIEKVFFAKNAVSALKLGQARGAAILTAMIHSLSVVEYSPTEVKQTVVGHGQADKTQVARMVGMLTGRTDFATSDASDGLALAICHAYRMRTPVDASVKVGATLAKKKNYSLAESVGAAAIASATSRTHKKGSKL